MLLEMWAIIFWESICKFIKVKQTSPVIRESKARTNSQWLGKLFRGWALLLQQQPSPPAQPPALPQQGWAGKGRCGAETQGG